jgi:hypothetical protein
MEVIVSQANKKALVTIFLISVDSQKQYYLVCTQDIWFQKLANITLTTIYHVSSIIVNYFRIHSLEGLSFSVSSFL